MLLVLGTLPADGSKIGPWRASGDLSIEQSHQAQPISLLAKAFTEVAAGVWTHSAILHDARDAGCDDAARASGWREAEELAAGLDGKSWVIFEGQPLTEKLSRGGDNAEAEAVQCMVFSYPRRGAEQQFVRWYERHLQDVLRVPGYASAQLFQILSQRGPTKSIWKFVTIYEVAMGRYEEAAKEAARRAGTEAMPITDAVGGRLSAQFQPFAWWRAARFM